jgi:hypothetical protein
MLRMSPIGTKRTWPCSLPMSAPEGRTDMPRERRQFRFDPKRTSLSSGESPSNRKWRKYFSLTQLGFCRHRNQFRDVFRAIPVGSAHGEHDCRLDYHFACAGQIAEERRLLCQFCGAP